LYQRIDNSGNAITVNGTDQSSLGEVTFSGASDNWLLSNYNTGFYLFAGSHSLKVNKAVQQNPNYDQIWPVDYSGNPTDTYYTGYIDHGTNPSNKSYEYILKPGSSIAEMQSLDTAIQGGNKPYTVHQKDANAHIVEHISKSIWGYVFFNSAAGLTYDLVTDVDSSCLLMTEYNSTSQTLLVSLSNPDIGFESRSFSPSLTAVKQVTLQGEWHFVTTHPDVQIISSNATETVIEFTTVDGLSYEVLLQQGPETCASITIFSAGTWDNGNPDATKKAIFTQDYTTSTGNVDACTCEVRAGATVTVNTGDYLQIEGNITVNGTLIVEHQGSVVQTDGNAVVANNGTINVNLSTPNLASRDFMILGSPMTGETRGSVWNSAFLVLDHNTLNFVPNAAVAAAFPGAENFADDNYDNWIAYNNAGTIDQGEGYLVRPQAGYGQPGGVFNYTYDGGTLHNGNINFSVLYNTPGPTAADNKNASPNVLANPYPSAVFADDFINGNTMIDEVFFWEHLTPPSPGLPGAGSMNFSMEDISMYNLSGGVPAASDPGTTTTPNGYISTGQGFGIKATAAGTATFTNSMRRTTNNNTLRDPLDKDRVWISVNNARYEMGGMTLIGFTQNATSGLDNGYDSRRLATVVSLYSHLEDGSEELGIQSREAFESGVKIPLGFSSQIEAELEFKISIANIEGLNLGSATLYLIDNYTNEVTNLSEGAYTFRSNKGTFHNRFTLQFEGEAILGSFDNPLEAISVFPNPTEGLLNIISPDEPITGVEVYDVRGRKLNGLQVNSEGNYTLDISDLETAIYFITITTEAGSITKRIVKR